MARPPRPFVYRGHFVSSFGGVKNQKLCREEEGFKAAQAALARLMVKRADGEQERPTPGPGIRVSPDSKSQRLVADLFNEFMRLKQVETSEPTFNYYRECLTPLFEKFGTRPLMSITLQDGLFYKNFLMREIEWKKGKKKMRGLGACSVNHRVRCARMMFGWAAKASRQYIPNNPWDEVKYLPEKERERLITDTEFSAMLQEATHGSHRGGDRDMREMLLLLRNTGMRPGEMRHLRWNYIQHDRHCIIFPADVIKTRNRRQVTTNDVVEKLLEERQKRLGSRSGYVFPGGDRSDPEKKMNLEVLSRRFRRLFDRCAKLKLVDETVSGERLVGYLIRHARLTELAAAKLPLKSLMQEAGHSNAKTTQRYVHLSQVYTASLVREARQVSDDTKSQD